MYEKVVLLLALSAECTCCVFAFQYSPLRYDLMSQLNDSAYEFVTEFADWLSVSFLPPSASDCSETQHLVDSRCSHSFEARQYDFIYQFYSDLADLGHISSIESGIRESMSECFSCVRDCSEFVLEIVSHSPDKRFVPYFNELLYNSTNQYSDPVGSFGWDPIFEQSSRIKLHEVQATDIEYGGGLGFGLQIYCDSIQVVSLGGGGGGGFHNGNKSSDYGGGSGGGIQINKQFAGYIESLSSFKTNKSFLEYFNYSAADSLDTIDLGGGMGCGTCASSLNKSSQSFVSDRCRFNGDVLCGYQKDCSSYQSNINATMIPIALGSCSSLRVEGGGGGGGGAAECCLPIGLGYGFHFSIVSQPLASATFHRELTVSDRSNQFTYDSTGLLFHLASKRGPCEGYSDWCCVCHAAKNISSICLDILSNSTYEKENSFSLTFQKCKKLGISKSSFIFQTNCCETIQSESSATKSPGTDDREDDDSNIVGDKCPDGNQFYWSNNMKNMSYANESNMKLCLHWNTNSVNQSVAVAYYDCLVTGKRCEDMAFLIGGFEGDESGTELMGSSPSVQYSTYRPPSPFILSIILCPFISFVVVVSSVLMRKLEV